MNTYATLTWLKFCSVPVSERLKVATTRCLAYKKKTINGYRYELEKLLVRRWLFPCTYFFSSILQLSIFNIFPALQWFVKMGHNCPQTIAWAEKTNEDLSNLSADLTTPIGRATIPKFLRWVAEVVPGWYERPECRVKKPTTAVSIIKILQFE